MANIIIAGAGFAGLSCALRLEKIFRSDPGVRIVLADRHDYHLFTPNLYEAATADEELVSVSQLTESLALPLKNIISGKKIEYIKGEVGLVNQENRTVAIGRRNLEYDYLVLALGGVPDFLGVEGADKHALPLGGIKDALRIRNAAGFAVQSRRLAARKDEISFVVAGGGCAGVGIAGELAGLLNFLAWKNSYPRTKLAVTLLESANRILPGFDGRTAKHAQDRLVRLGVKVETGALAAKVTSAGIVFLDNRQMRQDVLIWTAGTMAAPLKFSSPVKRDKKGRLPVDGSLLMEGSGRIFAIGEMSAGNGQKVYGIPRAKQEGEYAAEALSRLLKNRKTPDFSGKPEGYTIAIGGKWAISTAGGMYCRGRLAYFLGRWSGFCHYRHMVGAGRALKAFWGQEKVFARND